MILEELSKKDKQWRKAAYVICKDKMIADDLVQEMYLKLMNRTNWNDYFVFITLRNLFLDYLRKQKDVRLEELHYIEDRTEAFEPDDEELKILEEFYKLDWIKQELLLERSTGESLRDIEKKYNINYGFVYRQTTTAKEVILKNQKK